MLRRSKDKDKQRDAGLVVASTGVVDEEDVFVDDAAPTGEVEGRPDLPPVVEEERPLLGAVLLEQGVVDQDQLDRPSRPSRRPGSASASSSSPPRSSPPIRCSPAWPSSSA